MYARLCTHSLVLFPVFSLRRVQWLFLSSSRTAAFSSNNRSGVKTKTSSDGNTANILRLTMKQFAVFVRLSGYSRFICIFSYVSVFIYSFRPHSLIIMPNQQDYVNKACNRDNMYCLVTSVPINWTIPCHQRKQSTKNRDEGKRKCYSIWSSGSEVGSAAP